MKRLAGYTAVAMATITILLLLWQFRLIIGLFVLSLAAAGAIRPVVNRLVARGLPLSLAVVFTYLVTLGALLAFLFVLGRPMFDELQRLADDFAAAYEANWSRWSEEGTALQQAIVSRLPPPNDLYQAITGPQGEMIFSRVFGLTRGFLGAIGGLLAVVLVSIYWIVDQNRFERLWLSVLPAGRRVRARRIWRDIESGLGAYIRSEIVQSLVAVVLLGLGYWLIGLRYPALLAFLGAVAWIVPLVGAVLTAAPVFLVGLANGPVFAVGAVLYTVTVLLFLELQVEPRLFNRRRYSPILVVLVMLILVEDFGILGLIVAPPLAAAIQILLSRLLYQARSPAVANPSEQIAQLYVRLDTVRESYHKNDEPDSPEIINMIRRLNGLIKQAEQYLLEQPAAPRQEVATEKANGRSGK
ncbi:MAG: AI-2E family transporter [Chloroflexi bacterium]|nr:AI-2E family transporter [Chloroflexota bacterium]MCI0576708.1 AI-2E family transporter [Chloroflexota bacterium]MCI0649423.1 AI-2E family transporter [Chloroflexota bacterium]MCI0730777.1 AI-2E family transporter [Chloroflexota bacterium]